MGLNLTSPTTFTSAVLIGDTGTTGPSSDSLPVMTKVGSATVSAALEIQSTEGALLVPRMTTVERDALVTVVNGMQIYNSTDEAYQFRISDAWVNLGGGAGGAVTGPVTSTDNAISRWNGTTGDALQDSLVTIGDTGLIAAPLGAITTPTYSFTGDTNTGIWSSAGGILDFSSDGLRTLQLGADALAVNFLRLQSSAATFSPIVQASGSDTNVSVAVAGKGTGGFIIFSSTTGVAGKASFYNGASTFATTLTAGANLANLALTLPIADASANASATSIQVPLSSNGSGVTTFANTLSRYATRTLSAVNLAALFATPITVIPAPGAGFAVIIDQLVVELVFVSAAFTNGGTVYLQYGATAHGTNYATPVAGIAASVIQSAASTFANAIGSINVASGLAAATLNNAAVTITNATAAFDGGGDSTAVLHVWYTIVPVA